MKKFLIGAFTVLALVASAKTLVIRLSNGELHKYEVSEIAELTFEGQVVEQPKVALSVFTDPVMRAAVAAADADADSLLSAEEIATITELNLASSTVESLAGIEHLTDLKSINLLSCEGLTSVNLTGTADNLESLQVGFCKNLTSLVLGNKPVLKEVYAMYTKISDIDLSAAKNIEIITLQDTKMASIVLNDFKNLKKFTAGSDTLASVDLSGCDALVDISLYNAKAMTTFDNSKFPNLENLVFEGSKITKFDSAGNKNLKSLSLNNSSNLVRVDVSKSRKLTTLSCNACYNLQESAEVILSEGQNIPNMVGVYSWMIQRVPYEWPADIAPEIANEAFRTKMIEIADTNKDGQISKEEALAVDSLSLPNAGLDAVDLSFFNNITVLDLSGNNLTAIDLSGVPNLTALNIENNKIAGKLDVSYLNAVKTLKAAHNELTELSSFGSRTPVLEIDLSYNKFTTIRVQYMTNMTKLNLSHNQLTSATVTSNNKLADMDVSFNQIPSMTLWSLKTLEKVKFNDNPFTQLDESTNWTLLKEIDCSNTAISKLDLSKTSTLWTVKATGCPNLTTIYVGENGDAEITKDYNTSVVYGAPAQ